MNFWSLTALYPPILVRLLARRPNSRPLTELEIADASGLSPNQVRCISWSTDWAGIDLPTMQKFCRGCRFDLCNNKHRQRASVYIRLQVRAAKLHRRNWVYLRNSPEWETLFAPMIQRYREHLQAQAPTSTQPPGP